MWGPKETCVIWHEPRDLPQVRARLTRVRIWQFQERACYPRAVTIPIFFFTSWITL
jgi:hypothetical protein